MKLSFRDLQPMAGIHIIKENDTSVYLNEDPDDLEQEYMLDLMTLTVGI